MNKYPTTAVVGDCTGVDQVAKAVRGGFLCGMEFALSLTLLIIKKAETERPAVEIRRAFPLLFYPVFLSGHLQNTFDLLAQQIQLADIFIQHILPLCLLLGAAHGAQPPAHHYGGYNSGQGGFATRRHAASGP